MREPLPQSTLILLDLLLAVEGVSRQETDINPRRPHAQARYKSYFGLPFLWLESVPCFRKSGYSYLYPGRAFIGLRGGRGHQAVLSNRRLQRWQSKEHHGILVVFEYICCRDL